MSIETLKYPMEDEELPEDMTWVYDTQTGRWKTVHTDEAWEYGEDIMKYSPVNNSERGDDK